MTYDNGLRIQVSVLVYKRGSDKKATMLIKSPTIMTDLKLETLRAENVQRRVIVREVCEILAVHGKESSTQRLQ